MLGVSRKFRLPRSARHGLADGPVQGVGVEGQARPDGVRAAVELFRYLEAGYPVPVVAVPGWVGEPVHLDAACWYARWYARAEAGRAGPGLIAAVPPGLLLAAVAGQAIADAIGHATTTAARPGWQEAGAARVVVTASATWAYRDGAWIAFWHDSVMEYRVQDAGAVVTFADCEPLLLAGPAVWAHAVLFARLRLGSAWMAAPWLQGLQGR